MLEKTAFIDCDFMPPTAERFCLIPEALMAGGYESVCFKMIDNYPWSFDSRMKSDTAYDEKVIDFIVKKCCDLGLKLIFVFPGADNYCRLLRLNGYKRMIDPNSPLIRINSDAVGFNLLIESILEDFSSLCPELSSFALESISDSISYTRKINSILEKSGIKPVIIEDNMKFITVNSFLDSSDPELDSIFGELQQAQLDFSSSVFCMNVLLTMSSLGSNIPAADSCSLKIKYSAFTEYRKKIDALLKEFGIAAAGKIDENWLEIYQKSITLTADDSFDMLKHRLKRLGLLN